MNKEEINVDIMSSEELEDFEYLIQNYSKSKLAYKIIKIEEENKMYHSANFELQQENKQLKELNDNYKIVNEEHRILNGMLRERIDKTIETIQNYINTIGEVDINEILEILKGDSNE